MDNTKYVNKSVMEQSDYSDYYTYVNQQIAMDYQLCKIKTEPHESEKYSQQLCTEGYQHFNLNNQENVGIINAHHQSITSLGNVANYHTYNMLLDDEIIKTETEILDLNSYEVQGLPVQENLKFQSNQIIQQWDQQNENENPPKYLYDGNPMCNQDENTLENSTVLIIKETPTIKEETDTLEERKTDGDIVPITSSSNNTLTAGNYTFVGGGIIKTEPEILDLTSYEIQVLGKEENVIKVQPIQIMHQLTKPNENEQQNIFNSNGEKEELDGNPMNCHTTKYYSSQKFNSETISTAIPLVNEYALSAKHIWKSNDNNCTTCKKSFICFSHLKRHYNTTLHKNAVKSSGLPNPAIHPTNIHYPSKTQNHSDNTHYFKQRLDHTAIHKCDQCLKGFYLKSSLRKHMYLHTGKKLFTCSLCGKGFTSNYLMNKHKAVHTGEKPHKCDQCPKQFILKNDLNRHMCVHTGKKPFGCNLCAKQFITKHFLVKHKTIHGRGKHKCDKCPKQFCSNRKLKYHMYLHTENKPFSCKLCGKVFITKYQLRKHKTTHGTEKQYKCNQCPKQFGSNRKLIHHMYLHTGKKPFSCGLCGKGFVTTRNLNRHKPIHTGEKPYKCDQCPKQFTQKSNLTQHMYRHTEKKPFSCSFCGKEFLTKNNMINHKTMHRGEKPHKCDQCPKQFYHKTSLRRHMYLHTSSNLNQHNIYSEEKPHKCDQCPKQFKDKSNLTQHMYIHNEKKPFSCSLCGKGFVKKCDMIQHESIHNGQKSHKCNQCPKQFYHKGSLRRHMYLHT